MQLQCSLKAGVFQLSKSSEVNTGVCCRSSESKSESFFLDSTFCLDVQLSCREKSVLEEEAPISPFSLILSFFLDWKNSCCLGVVENHSGTCRKSLTWSRGRQGRFRENGCPKWVNCNTSTQSNSSMLWTSQTDDWCWIVALWLVHISSPCSRWNRIFMCLHLHSQWARAMQTVNKLKSEFKGTAHPKYKKK